jgi:hypothetical protein
MRQVEAVYTPSNEPYLGRESVFQFDQTIMRCLKKNASVAQYTRENVMTELQAAACQLIPQRVNLALTIRELVRQGYLFGAVVLLRPLVERAGIVSYLVSYPDAVDKWGDGWQRGERPALSKMLETMGGTNIRDAKGICEMFGHIVHGDPVGAGWNLVHLSEGGLGYSVGKTIDDPELCDFVCFQAYCYLIVLDSIMSVCFPGIHSENNGEGS